MRNTILEIAERPARLRVQREQLVVEFGGGEPEHQVPLDDLAVVIVSNPQVSCTHAVLSEIAARGGMFVTCDAARMPVGVMLPLRGHTTQAERFRSQIEAGLPRKKRLWQQIVQAKIRMQGEVLEEVNPGGGAEILALVRQVGSGDPSNIEARAARRYWSALFGSDFRRDRDAEDQNRMLNYGYAVLRSVVARALVGSGLHPSIGVHHHNKYNAYCLADDLMEPYRPVVDRVVWRLMDRGAGGEEFGQETRRELLGVVKERLMVNGEARETMSAVELSADSLARALEDRERGLVFPTGIVSDARE